MLDAVKRAATYTRNKVLGDSMEPENRYLNLDGTPYGSEDWMRQLANPYLKIRILGIVVSSIFQAHSYHIGMKGVFFNFAERLPLAICIQYWGIFLTKKEMAIIPSSAVIDKKAQWGSNPSATMMLKDIYKNKAKPNLILWGITSTGVGLLEHSAVLANELLLLSAAKSMWQLYAAYNLNKGKWVVKTDPPGITKKVKQAIPAGAKAEI